VNGVHDMGGVHGFGTVHAEVNEPVFHAEWERRTFALAVALGATGEWTLDAFRRARESVPPAEYLGQSYYATHLAALEQLLLKRSLVAPDELAAGRSIRPARPVRRTLVAGDVAATLARGLPSVRPSTRPARFHTGERVRARNMHPAGHTRLPRYVRGHAGTIVLVHGCHVFPDSRAHDGGEDPQWLYTMSFEARELWGPEADPTATISVDAFEPYLEAAPLR
jgi:nitrile hydratase